MKLLIIGYGSIGKRHANNARALDHKVILLRHPGSARNEKKIREYFSFKELWRNEKDIDGAVICSPTTKHLRDAEMLIKKRIPFLIEKPPTTDLKGALRLQKKLSSAKFKWCNVAYNLRYYPALQFIKNFLPKLGKIYCIRAHADFFLPKWRKDIDYRKTISAKKELGGGVHRELVHEIDYLLWFFGLPEKVFGCIDKISALDINTEDICSAIFKYKNGMVAELHLGYLSHRLLRGCQIIAERGTLEWNISSKKVTYQAKDSIRNVDIFRLPAKYDFNETYIQELKNFIGLINRRKKPEVSIGEAAGAMKVLSAIERSSRSGKWVFLNSNR